MISSAGHPRHGSLENWDGSAGLNAENRGFRRCSTAEAQRCLWLIRQRIRQRVVSWQHDHLRRNEKKSKGAEGAGRVLVHFEFMHPTARQICRAGAFKDRHCPATVMIALGQGAPPCSRHVRGPVRRGRPMDHRPKVAGERAESVRQSQHHPARVGGGLRQARES